jgi:hypothetical protein
MGVITVVGRLEEEHVKETDDVVNVFDFKW